MKRARRHRRVLWAVLLSSFLFIPVTKADEQLNNAIDKGIEYLKAQIKAKHTGQHLSGQVALETYALITAGVSVKDPLITQNFKILGQMVRGSTHTYSVACYIFALDAAISQLEQDKVFANLGKKKVNNRNVGKIYRDSMRTAVNTLAKTQNSFGAWRYFKAADFDNSNVQFAVLGLGVGAKRGIEIPPKVWDGVYKHLVKGQQKTGGITSARIELAKPEEDRRLENIKQASKLKLIGEDGEVIGVDGKPSKVKDSPGKKKNPPRRKVPSGRRTVARPPPIVLKPEDDPIVGEEITPKIVKTRGWDYTNNGGNTWNMTCAGVSSCLVLRENIKGNIDKDGWKKLNTAIADGYGQLMATWSPFSSLYGLYSLEKVADIGGVKLFNGTDWYGAAKTHLIGVQQADGSWAPGAAAGENLRVATSFALLVLKRASSGTLPPGANSLLTRKPGANIIRSGRTVLGNKDRAWVYLPKLNTSVNYQAVLELIKKRPSRELLVLLKDVVAAYPERWKGELILPLIKSHGKTSSKSIKKILVTHLETIARIEYPTIDEYTKWHVHWSRAIKAGAAIDKGMAAELLDDYKNDLGSVELKKKAAWALSRLGERKALDLFLGDLENGSAEVRHHAYVFFKGFFVNSPPDFIATAPKKTRARQVAAIRQWYAERK